MLSADASRGKTPGVVINSDCDVLTFEFDMATDRAQRDDIDNMQQLLVAAATTRGFFFEK